MADRDDTYRNREATEQGESGKAGARASQTEGVGSQPAQASNRRGAAHQQERAERKHFEPGHAPSEQGEQDHPSPHVIAQHQQGLKPRSGSHMQGDRSQERAVGGEPHGEHTRGGRQNTPPSREDNG